MALLSLQTQTLPADQFEVLVIDNCSTDNTKQVVESFQQQAANIRYFFDPTPGLHVGRHYGLREAKGDVLVYADDDIEAMPGWLSAIADCFADPDVAMVGGNNLPKYTSPPPDWLLTLWEKPSLGGRAIPALSVLELNEGRREFDPRYIWGCNFSIQKSVLQDAGGFHPDAMPQDLIRFRGDGETHVSNYVRNSGLKTLFDSKASVYHQVTAERMTKEYFCRRYFAQGISDSYTEIRSQGCIPGKEKHVQDTFRSVKRRLLSVKQWVLSPGPVELELSNILNASQQAYLQGYRYHNNEVSADSALFEWVLREHYW
jgi:glycosyltransferase involved in cell wall biosynthesis